jgi:hypothetical protein
MLVFADEYPLLHYRSFSRSRSGGHEGNLLAFTDDVCRMILSLSLFYPVKEEAL